MRVLGLDLGSTSIKAVELDTAFGRYDIHDYHELKIEAGADPLDVAKTLIKSLPKSPDRVAVSLKTGQTTFRNLQLPTKDRKAIQASIGFELDDDLPFPLEQSIYDYSILSQTGQTTHVHVATTMRKYVERQIADTGTIGLDPDIITSQAWAYRTLLNRIIAPSAQQQPIMLAQIGHRKTTLYIHWRGFPVFARELQWGGADISAAICKKFSIPLEQAEQAKIQHGFVLPGSQKQKATREQIEFSDAILEPISEFIRDLRQVALICKNITHTGLSALYVAGGTSLLPGFSRVLEEELSLTVKPLQALSSVNPSGVTYSEHSDATFVEAIALALCFVKTSDRSVTINFRKGSQAKHARTRELTLSALKGPMIGLGAVVTSMFVSLMIQTTSYNSELKTINTQMEKSIKSLFGQVSSSAMRTYIASPSALKNSVNKELGKQRELSKLHGPNPQSPLNFLADQSSSIPSDLVVDLTQVQVGSSPTRPYSPDEQTTATLSFLIASPQIAEKLASLETSKLSGLERSKIEEVTSPDGSTKKWKITLSGKPTEETYGK